MRDQGRLRPYLLNYNSALHFASSPLFLFPHALMLYALCIFLLNLLLLSFFIFLLITQSPNLPHFYLFPFAFSSSPSLPVPFPDPARSSRRWQVSPSLSNTLTHLFSPSHTRPFSLLSSSPITHYLALLFAIHYYSFPQSNTHATPRKNGTGVRFCCAKRSRSEIFPVTRSFIFHH